MPDMLSDVDDWRNRSGWLLAILCVLFLVAVFTGLIDLFG
jgi:hypothetical protein